MKIGPKEAQRRALRDGMSRLRAYVSPLETAPDSEKQALTSYAWPEVSGSLPKRRRSLKGMPTDEKAALKREQNRLRVAAYRARKK